MVVQLLAGWAGHDGWVWTVDFSFRKMNLVGETLAVWARVTDRHLLALEAGEVGVVDVELGITNDDSVESTPGTGRVVLPRRSGPPIPYPFPLGEADRLRPAPDQ